MHITETAPLITGEPDGSHTDLLLRGIYFRDWNIRAACKNKNEELEIIMENNAVDKKNIEKLSYELTYHKYLMNKDKVHHLFTDLTVAEYITLHDIAKLAPDRDVTNVKTYLQDLTGVLKMPIHGVSKLAGELKEKGLVIWSHDGNGSEGTYVTITERGLKLMERQEEILRKYYGAVIDRFGKENMINLLKKVEELETVVDGVFSEIGEELYGN